MADESMADESMADEFKIEESMADNTIPWRMATYISYEILKDRRKLAPPRDAEAIRGPAHTVLALLQLARTHAQQATS